MAKVSMSSSKSSFLPEATTTSPSLYTTSYAPKTELHVTMKCVTSHYSQRSIDELQHLLVKVSADSKIAASLTLGCTKLVYVINYGLKKYFLDKLRVSGKIQIVLLFVLTNRSTKFSIVIN